MAEAAAVEAEAAAVLAGAAAVWDEADVLAGEAVGAGAAVLA